MLSLIPEPCNNKSECWAKLNPVHTAQQCDCFNDLTHDDNESQCQDKTKCYWCNNTSKCRSAIIDLDGMCNTAALVIVQNRYDGASIKYVSAMFFVDYQNGNAPDKLSDPDNAFSNGDVDGKNCLFKNGNGSFRYKNRSGVTNQTVIHVLEFQGN